MKGMIFDIQRCSFHDGPGIRTTVFLKGCPLKCVWCHNPESITPKRQIMYDSDKCINCLACVETCPASAHFVLQRVHWLKHDLCRCCGECIKKCPGNALKIIGEELDSEAVITEVERDMEYYLHSGGGMTLSGGEPMFQFDFTVELLKKAKKRGINTCIETCGFANMERYREIIQLTDLFLFDYKETDSERHRMLTGVINELILSNLEFLYNSGAEIILRCPLIPGVNDNPEHIKGIAQLSHKYPSLLEVEIMAYHSMGKNKAVKIGNNTQLCGVEAADEHIKSQWISELNNYGCMKVKIS